MNQDIRDRLKKAIQYRTLVPFIGSGVSAGAAGLPLWGDLVELGIVYGSQRPNALITVRDASILRRLAKSGDVMTALSKLQKIFAQDSTQHWNSHHYAGWLETIFGTPSVTDPSVLDEIRRLEPRVIVTTNYDLLLEEYVMPTGRSISWERPHELRSMLRGGSGIAHLHGRYDRPQSVILSDSDYQRIITDDTAFRVSQSLFESGTLIFIGASSDGVSDPHLAKLLENFAQLSDPFDGEDYPHILLCQGTILPQQRSRLRTRGIEVLSYGDRYEDLAPFLATIASRERVTVALDEVKVVSRSIAAAPTKEAGIHAAARAIENWVFRGVPVRVGYAELTDDPVQAGRQILLERYVVPADSPCVFHYPVSIAGWSVAEARRIAWPRERHRVCDIERVRKLGRYDDVFSRIRAESADLTSPLRDYLALDALMDKFETETAVISDLFQDWSNTPQEVLFMQFISVPVPRVASLTNTAAPAGVGVFNIDTLSEEDLLSEDILEKLEFISDLVYSLYLRHDAQVPGVTA
jgi:SIR2-like domain